jgi:hypothetical protein
MILERPNADEYAPFYAGYVSRVPDGDVLALLETEFAQDIGALEGLGEARKLERYAPDKWSVVQIVQHMVDTERVFTFRALHVARGDSSALPGFDQDAWLSTADAEQRTLEAVLEGWRFVRAASLSLFKSFTPAMWTRRGVVSGNTVTPRALAFITLGHELHHRAVLREHYDIG